jgi:PST family polysaccharide transporter
MDLLRSSLWATLGSWSHQILSFLTIIIIARLLPPEYFGIIAIAMLFVLLVQRLLFESIALGIIRLEDEFFNEQYRRTAFSIAMLVGISLSFLFYIFSDFIADIFNQDQLGSIFKIFSVLPTVEALGVVHVGLLRRNSEFKSLAGRTLVSNLLGGVTGISLALTGFGIWALVFQHLVVAVVGAGLLWVLSAWRPVFGWDKGVAKRISRFGLPMFGNAAIFVLANRIDIAFLGLFSGPVATGIYNVSKRVVRTVTDLTSTGIAHAQLSHLSNNVDSEVSRSVSFANHIQMMAFLTFPIYAGSALLVDQFVPLVFGENWLDAIPVMQVLLLFGPAQVTQLLATNYLVALGRGSMIFNLNLAALVILVLALGLAISAGTIGVAVVFVSVGYLLSLAQITVLLVSTPVRVLDLLKGLMPASMCVVIMAIVVNYVYLQVQGINTLIAIMLCVAAGIVSYAAISMVIQRQVSLTMIRMIQNLLVRQ